MWIELPWPENLENTCMWHTETLHSCFNLIKSHQQSILWSLPLVIKPATTECRAKTLQLNPQSTLHICVAKSTSHGNCVASVFVCLTKVFARFSGHGKSIHNIISQLKKENVHANMKYSNPNICIFMQFIFGYRDCIWFGTWLKFLVRICIFLLESWSNIFSGL